MPGDEHKHDNHDDVAIIGSACQFPGDASSEATYWDLLYDRKCP